MYKLYQIRKSTGMVEFVIDSMILIPENDNFSYIDFSTLPSDFNHELRYKLVDGSLQSY